MSQIATILIGRNEGARLEAALTAVPRGLGDVVYVDSGSTDGSLEAARAAGAIVVELDTTIPFTAARARNAGVAALRGPHDLIQFIDGDCALDPDWIDTARQFLKSHPDAAVVCGRRRERFPDASIYNRMCDHEWDTPIGQAKACGGDALMRADAFAEVGGFDGTLIAGEEPELCVRLRAAGWSVWRIDAEMTLHDADMTRFSQFWKRMRRGGFACAQGAAMHGAPPELHGVAQRNRALLWGLALPGGVVLGLLIAGPVALVLALIYPAQIVRLARREGATRAAWERATLLTLGKFAEVRGIAEYHIGRLRGRRAELIEYK